MTDQFMLSTIDNPFNPFVDFDSWKNFDEDQGYNTCEYLSLNSDELSFELSDSQNQKIINKNIQDIVDNDLLGIYIRVRPESKIRILT